MSASGYDLRPRQLRALLVLLILLPLLPSAVIVRFFIDAASYERSTVGENWRGFYTSYARALGGYIQNQAGREFADQVEGAALSPQKAAHQISARQDVDSVVVFSTASPGGEVWQSGVLSPATDAPAAIGMIGSLRGTVQDKSMWRSLPGTGLLGRVIEGEGWWLVILREPIMMQSRLESFLGGASGPDIRWVVMPSRSTPVLPMGSFGREPIAYPLDAVVTGWSLWVGPSETGIRNDAGLGEQIRLYQQVSLLVLGAVLILGLLAGWAITRQIRLQDMRSTALAAVAHELKTPIASSRLLIDTLESMAATGYEALRDYIRLLAKDNKRLARVVSDFLLFSKIEQKRLQLTKSRVELDTVMEEALHMSRASIEESGVRMDVQDAVSGVVISGDHDMMVRAVVNLIENAITHSGRAGRLALQIRMFGSRHADLIVADNGQGIPTTELHNIFRPFHQVDTRLSRGHEGAGLGLSIVRQIVAAHGGSVWAESDGRSGATFTIRLPVVRS